MSDSRHCPGVYAAFMGLCRALPQDARTCASPIVAQIQHSNTQHRHLQRRQGSLQWLKFPVISSLLALLPLTFQMASCRALQPLILLEATLPRVRSLTCASL